MATHSSILAWKISWTEEPGGLQCMGSQRVGHDWATNTYAFWGREPQKRCNLSASFTSFVIDTMIEFLLLRWHVRLFTVKSLSFFLWFINILVGDTFRWCKSCLYSCFFSRCHPLTSVSITCVSKKVYNSKIQSLEWCFGFMGINWWSWLISTKPPWPHTDLSVVSFPEKRGKGTATYYPVSRL